MSELADALWKKYACKDSHGYQDFIGQDAFEAAIDEALSLGSSPQRQEKP